MSRDFAQGYLANIFGSKDAKFLQVDLAQGWVKLAGKYALMV